MLVVRRLNTKEPPSIRPTVILTQALRTGSSKKVRTSLDFFLSVVPRKCFINAQFKATLWPSRQLKWAPIIYNSLLLRLLSSEVSAFFSVSSMTFPRFPLFRVQCGKSGGEGPGTRGGPRFSSVPHRAWCQDKNLETHNSQRIWTLSKYLNIFLFFSLHVWSWYI